jgi:hypothetical protein
MWDTEDGKSNIPRRFEEALRIAQRWSKLAAV